MLLSELLKGIEYTVKGGVDVGNTSIDWIYCDSRKITLDSLFVCIRGALSDGHNYVSQAYEFGCRVFVVERFVDTLPSDAVQIKTKDTRVALAKISDAFFGHPSKGLQIIGITGTKGKTTTAQLIYQTMNQAGINCAYIGTSGVMYNDVIKPSLNTTPESYDLHYYMRKMVDGGVKVLAMEVSSQALYQSRVYGIKFDVCVFTNLYRGDHVGNSEHPSFEHYRDCKASLFRDYGAECIVYNADDEFADYMVKGTGTLLRSFGIKNDADFVGSDIALYRDEGILGVKFTCKTGRGDIPITLNVPGDFSVYNALCAMSVCDYFGISPIFSAKVLENVLIKGRFEVVSALPYCTFVIDYAHNGNSLRAVLGALAQYSPNRKICLFGSVGGRTRLRRRELGKAAAELADLAIITSDNPDFESPEAIVDEIASYFGEGSCPYVKIPDRVEAIKYAVREAKEGDIVLFAGKGHEDYQLICGEKVPFSEKEIILSESAKILEENMIPQA